MTWWQYLILVNIYLLLFYSFYVLLLKRETFFQLNRIYLVTASLLSFFIPLIQSSWAQSLFITQSVQRTIYTSPVMYYQFNPIQHTHITIGQIIGAIYITGIAFLTIRLIWQLIVLKRLIDEPQASAAYSFFKTVRLGDDLMNNDVVVAHENTHVKQWHSADILLVEAVMIINWFNPVVYYYRFAIKHIHEFIADRQAIKAGTTLEDYALLLLSQAFDVPIHHLVNPFFNQSLLKQRIKMLQKNRSKYAALIKYGLSAPLFMLMLILSSATVNNSRPVRLFNDKAKKVFLTDATPSASEIADSIGFEEKTNNQPVKKAKEIFIVPTAAVKEAPVDKDVFTSVEQVPEFPGGLSAFGRFLGSNIKYPAESRAKGIQGRVIIGFIVEKDGALTDFKVIRGLDDAIDKEAIRVLKLSPNWTSGVQNGKAVRVAFSVPIAFTLLDAASENKNAGNVSADITTKDYTAKNDTDKNAGLVMGASTRPLYIVDGREMDNDYNLENTNPKDIQSINVMREKSGMAIYGSKAKNGVIIVTTKKSTASAAKQAQ